MTRIFSSTPKSSSISKQIIEGTPPCKDGACFDFVKKAVSSNQVSKKENKPGLEKTSQKNLLESDLGLINLFNPPKSNPNGRLASSKLFKKNKSQKLAQFRENKPQYCNLWRVSAVSIILLTNIVSALVIFRDKNSLEQVEGTPPCKDEACFDFVNQKPKSSLEIIAGKTDLATQEFIKLDLNSLSRISLKDKEDDTTEPDMQSQVTSPLAIPPTNLPSRGVIDYITTDDTSYYYILVEYTGEDSLKLAQKQVSNVSLVNFPQGIFIYLGAFAEKTLAQKFVNTIAAEGLRGYIYHDK